MKKLALVLFALLVIQSYGIYGAAQTQGIVYTCTMEVGPLCFAWEQSAISKIVGPDNAKKMEGKFLAARDAWEERWANGLKAGPLERAIDDAAKAVGEGINDVADAVKKAVNGEE